MSAPNEDRAFTLSLTLGNAAMSTPEHVADALRKVAARLDCGDIDGPVRDDNGNTVGEYRYRYVCPLAEWLAEHDTHPDIESADLAGLRAATYAVVMSRDEGSWIEARADLAGVAQSFADAGEQPEYGTDVYGVYLLDGDDEPRRVRVTTRTTVRVELDGESAEARR